MYITAINTIQSSIIKKSVFDIQDYITHYDAIVGFCKTKGEGGSSYLNRIHKVMSFFRKEDDPIMIKYKDAYQSMRSISFIKAKKVLKFTWKDLENNWQKLKTTIDKYKSWGTKPSEIMGYRQFLAYSLYILIPPLRPEDWLTSKLVKVPEGGNLEEYSKSNNISNFLDLTSGHLFISDYKSKCLQVPFRNINLNAPLGEPIVLMDIIRKWVDHYQSNPTHLFVKKNKNPMASNDFCQFFEKIPVTSPDFVATATDFRNLYISYKVHDCQMSKLMREKVAYIMGHSLETQYLTYSKYTDSITHAEQTIELEED
jgi:hypothetical protein